ncbi:MAG: ATP-binding protein [Bryobacter sp.]|nr:ATP-binding protein [Bryobacter sp.]
MSLKIRLRLTILVPLLVIALGYSVLSLNTVAGVLFQEAAESSRLLASQVQTLLVQRVAEYSRESPASADLEETKVRWTRMAAQDQALSRLLEQTMASTRTVVEIDILSANYEVLASSNPRSIGTSARPAALMSDWQQSGKLRQIWRVLTQDEEYETSIPLGLQGQAEPLFRLRVLVSSILLRNALSPEVNNLLYALGLSLLLATALALFAGNFAFQPLLRLSEAIDKISRGEALGSSSPKDLEEMQIVESKLSLLGQQVRGTQEDLRQMRGNVEQLIERMEDAVLLFDQEERLVNAGRAASNFLGGSRFELMGARLDEVFPAGTALGEIVHSAVSLRRPLTSVEATIDKAGLPARRVLVSLEWLQDFDSLATNGFLLKLRDADAQRSLSKQLDVGQRLSALNRLTGGVAHEIKNPLNSINLHLEVLRGKLETQGLETTELNILRDETKRLDRVVKTFLDFTKPVELKLAPIDLRLLLEGLLQFLMPEAQTKRVALGLDADTSSAFIQGDSDLLKQALLNLLRNGMEAMLEGGPLAVTLRREEGEFVIRIADQGVGIPEENRARIFQLYYTTKASGTGIGLAVTYRVVQLHNGSITFESKTGKGTTFELRFPGLEQEA